MLHIAMMIIKTEGRMFVGEHTPLTLVPSSREGTLACHENEGAGGATSARRKNPPCKSLPAGTRVIGKEKERAGVLDRRDRWSFGKERRVSAHHKREKAETDRQARKRRGWRMRDRVEATKSGAGSRGLSGVGERKGKGAIGVDGEGVRGARALGSATRRDTICARERALSPEVLR